MSTTAPELMPVTSTSVAEFNATEAGLAALREELAGATFDCTTTEGDRLARESRRGLVALRVELEAKRKELKAPLLEQGRRIDDEAKRITGEIVKLETPIDKAIKAEEAASEQRRQERARKAAEELAAVNADIERIRTLPLTYVAATADVLRETITALESRNLAEVFDDTHLPRAEEAAAAALAGLNRALDARIAADEEWARQRSEREALERQQAEAAAERAEADRRAEDERIKADALAAEKREAERAEQERIAAEQAEERKRLDAERAELARQQQAAEQKRQEEAEAARVERERAEQERAQAEWRDARTVDIVFAPCDDAPDFVEVETLDGKSVRVGEWHTREDGYRCLRLVLAEPVA